MLTRVLLATLCLLLSQALSRAAVETRSLPIVLGKDSSGRDIIGECELAWDDAVKTPRPGILVFHEYFGLNSYTKARARQLAELGYVALAVDLYGEGKSTTDREVAARWASELKSNRDELRRRATAALSTLAKLREVDPTKLAAIGYCFGGTTALELARSGANLQAVVSFHGDLAPLPPLPAVPPFTPATTPSATPSTQPAPAIKARILVCHGAIDPLVPPKTVQAFMDEMATAGVDYVFIAYAKAVHAFTNPAAGAPAPGKAAAYDQTADRRSWEAMRAFLTETLK